MAIWSAVSYLYRLSPSLKPRWMSGHVVICGMGRTGKLFASSLADRGVRIVGEDLGPPEAFEEWRAETRVPMIFGDFVSQPLLEKAGAARCRAIIFVAGDDLSNLEGAISAYEWLQSDSGDFRLIWAQITNEKLADSARLAVRTRGRTGIRFFDTYRIAAISLIAKYFNRETRRGINEVNILGFGKFGHDLMDALIINLESDEKMDIRVIDVEDREDAVMSLADEMGVAHRVTFERAAIQNMNMEDKTDSAFFLCTDDDLSNLTAAMVLTRNVQTANIYVRMVHWPISAVAENLGQEHGVVFVNINELVVQGIGDLPGIFEPARAADLKRTKLSV